MRIESLHIENLKAIKRADLEDIPRMVVVAGPNGCGKSTLFDAIRLLKSIYGGYQANEWEQWFSEFQIQLGETLPELLSLFNDPKRQLTVGMKIGITDQTRQYLLKNLESILKRQIWSRINPGGRNSTLGRSISVAAQLSQYGPEVEEQYSKESQLVKKQLKNLVFEGELQILPSVDEPIRVKESPILQLMFSSYDPENIGIIDYHGSQRHYERERVGGINLNIQTTEQRASQHALYNHVNKYKNIKDEMAAQLVRDVLAKEAGAEIPDETSLTESLKELFEKFFPGKHFEGPVPTKSGSLRFPVRTDDGEVHDINDLSSGEKEVLYGYLRLHNLSPRSSVLLLDEPELHLNPRLVQGLPQFYQKYLGKPYDNQLWLVTHSDALLREALETEEAGVYHMLLPSYVDEGEGQVQSLKQEEDIQHAIIDLVGDLATYKPGAKVVIFEGEAPSEFDVGMVSKLFPDFVLQVNPISGGNKNGVKNLHKVLETARSQGILPFKVYSIIDKDFGDPHDTEGIDFVSWDVYHIENYLLNSEFILKVGQDALSNKFPHASSGEVEEALRECAEDIIPKLVVTKLQEYVWSKLVGGVNTNINPNSTKIAADMGEVIEKTVERFNDDAKELLSERSLKRKEEEIRLELQKDLEDGNWRTNFPGREIIASYCGKYLPINKDILMNLIIGKMRDENFKPHGMKVLLERILED